MGYSIEKSRDLALAALIRMSEDAEVIAGFLGATGLRAEDLRGMAADPDLALHVLDYLLQEDVRVVEVAESLAIRPEELMAARTVLAGPGSHNWDVE